ncbi:MAG TPA: hypothetical protein VK517_02855 [Cyclobacteriaceae bacterium]|nr:hypothetical protein [Cyclobacteriaceae bacterium]
MKVLISRVSEVQILLFALLVFLFGCANRQEKQRDATSTVRSADESSVPRTSSDTSIHSMRLEKEKIQYRKAEAEVVFAEFKSLYNELLKFKNAENFKRYGLTEGGPYNNWLKKVEDLKNNHADDILIEKSIFITDLEQLGFAYVGSKGKETEVTKTFNEIFSNAIAPNP